VRQVSIDGAHVEVFAALRGESCWLDAFGVAAEALDLTHAPPRSDRRGGSGRVTAAMHGLVVKLAVQPGQAVRRGELLLAIEAMKMEHRIEAPVDGTVTEVGVSQGLQVAPGRLLVSIEPAAAAGSPAA
jgi:geranyl-CoA carboxylase alpha subunit